MEHREREILTGREAELESLEDSAYLWPCYKTLFGLQCHLTPKSLKG